MSRRPVTNPVASAVKAARQGDVWLNGVIFTHGQVEALRYELLPACVAFAQSGKLRRDKQAVRICGVTVYLRNTALGQVFIFADPSHRRAFAASGAGRT